MMEEILSKQDRIFIKSIIGQIILVYLFVLIIVSILITAFIIISNALNVAPYFKILTLLIVVMGFAGFLIKSLYPYLIDLSDGKKKVITGIVTKKEEKAKYSYHQNIPLDLTRQPKLMEYFVWIDNAEVQVNEKYYREFEVNDKIEVSKTLNSMTIIALKNL